jgi:hypothetical protein
MESPCISHVDFTGYPFPLTHYSEFATKIKAILAFVPIKLPNRFRINAFHKKTFDFGTLVGDDVGVTESRAEFPKVSENGRRGAKVFARQLMDQGFASEGPVNKKVLNR